MRARFLLAPAWVHVLAVDAVALVGGAVGLAAVVLLGPDAMSPWVVVLVVAVLVLVLLAASPWAAERATRLRYPLLALADRPTSVVAAARAVRRGPVPGDPDVREAAHGRAVELVAQSGRSGWRVLGPVVGSVSIVLNGRGAWWTWAVVAAVLALVASTEVSIRRVRSRVVLLRG